MKTGFVALICVFFVISVNAADVPPPAPKENWTDKLSLKGYTQVRYNRLFDTNPALVCELCDKSLGQDKSFFIRRARITISGDVHEQVFIYLQPDFASNASTSSQHFVQLRDLYADVSLTARKETRFRIGQSKVPFGWENLQSSSIRAAFDRTDSLNTGAPNERDLGIFAYWAPTAMRKRFKELGNPYLKGSGDYGILGFGAYVGQTANRPELNNNLHVVARATAPFRLSNGQFFETSLQAYTGLYTIGSFQRTTGVGASLGGATFRDERVAATFVWYPQPFGLVAEANVGTGPEYNPATLAIEERRVRGAFVQLMANVFEPGDVRLMPYVRGQYYHGGKKLELDARSHLVRELEIGAEWQPFKAFELTAAYSMAARRTNDSADPLEDQRGNRVRLQAQFNY